MVGRRDRHVPPGISSGFVQSMFWQSDKVTQFKFVFRQHFKIHLKNPWTCETHREISINRRWRWHTRCWPTGTLEKFEPPAASITSLRVDSFNIFSWGTRRGVENPEDGIVLRDSRCQQCRRHYSRRRMKFADSLLRLPCSVAAASDDSEGSDLVKRRQIGQPREPQPRWWVAAPLERGEIRTGRGYTSTLTLSHPSRHFTIDSSAASRNAATAVNVHEIHSITHNQSICAWNTIRFSVPKENKHQCKTFTIPEFI